MPIDLQVRRDAVLRILQGKSTEASEAKLLRVNRSTVSRWVAAEAQRMTPAPAAAGTPAGAEPPKPAAAAETPLEKARAAAGAPTANPLAITPDEVRSGGALDDAKLCIQTIGGLKAAGVYLVAQFRGVPGDEPALRRVAPLSEMAQGAIAQNAHWLAPILRKQAGPEFLYGILALEGFLAWLSIGQLARKYSLKESDMCCTCSPPCNHPNRPHAFCTKHGGEEKPAAPATPAAPPPGSAPAPAAPPAVPPAA